jgi:HSP20 family protein
MLPRSKYYSGYKTKAGIDGLMNAFFNAGLGEFVGQDGVRSPVFVNILEFPNRFVLQLAAPGFEKQDFSAAINNGRLHVKARRSAGDEAPEGKFTRREFLVSDFERSFKVPDSVNKDAVEAVYENGVLQVIMPKLDAAKPTTVPIHVG